MASSDMPNVEVAHGDCATGSPIRDRVAVTVRWSPDVPARGVVLFCHGLGMGRDTYPELCAHWASAGYAVVAPEFADAVARVAAEQPALGLDPTDPALWMTDAGHVERFLAMMFDPQQWLGRVADATAVADSLDALLGAAGATDYTSAAGFVVAGHSYGAHTTQILAGARVDTPDADGVSLRHPGVIGAILMSPQGSGERGLTRDSWTAIDLPWLVISGEHDIAARGQGVEWRRETYDLAPPGGRALAVLRGTDHGLGGIGGSADLYADDPVAVAAVHALTLRFVTAAFAAAVPDLAAVARDHPLVMLEEK